MGHVYLRGKTYWIKYYDNGRPIYESAKTTKESEAKRLLKEREGRVARGEPILRRIDQIRYEEIAQDLRQHYQTTGSRDLREAGYRLKHLDRYFACCRVATIGSAEITAYAAHRKQEGAEHATINRELETLGRMLRLAYEHGKLARLPIVHKLAPNPPRQGFFEREQFEAVCQYLPLDYQLALKIAHTYGWRMQSEVLPLTLTQIDLKEGTLRLEPGTTKNNDGRVVYLTPELKGLIQAQIERVRALERELGRIIPYLFPHLRGLHRGERIQDFKRAWRTACKKAGCLGMLRHDLRRTAVRNLVNLGIPEVVAMKVTGHRSRTVFDRYHIVSPADLQNVARKLSALPQVTKTVTTPSPASDALSVTL